MDVRLGTNRSSLDMNRLNLDRYKTTMSTKRLDMPCGQLTKFAFDVMSCCSFS